MITKVFKNIKKLFRTENYAANPSEGIYALKNVHITPIILRQFDMWCNRDDLFEYTGRDTSCRDIFFAGVNQSKRYISINGTLYGIRVENDELFVAIPGLETGVGTLFFRMSEGLYLPFFKFENAINEILTEEEKQTIISCIPHDIDSFIKNAKSHMIEKEKQGLEETKRALRNFIQEKLNES